MMQVYVQEIMTHQGTVALHRPFKFLLVKANSDPPPKEAAGRARSVL